MRLKVLVEVANLSLPVLDVIQSYTSPVTSNPDVLHGCFSGVGLGGPPSSHGMGSEASRVHVNFAQDVVNVLDHVRIANGSGTRALSILGRAFWHHSPSIARPKFCKIVLSQLDNALRKVGRREQIPVQ